MTNLITLTIPNDDHIALRAFGKALEEMALAHGAEPRKSTVGEMTYKLNIDTSEATAALERLNAVTAELSQAAPEMIQAVKNLPEVDTTAQQVVPGATHIITEQMKPGELVRVSQGYTANVEEIPNPVDSTGTHWDERIHSASKALNSDGTWRLRRKPKDMDETEWAATVQKVQDELRFPQEPVPVTSSDEELCIDEGCPHHGTDHICVNPQPPVTLEETLNDAINVAHTAIAQEFGKGIANAAFTGNSAVEPPVTPPGDDFHTDAGVVTEQTVAGIPPIPVPPPVVVPPVPHTIPVTVEVVNDWDFPKLMKFLTERHGKIDVPTVNQLLAVDGLVALTDLNAHPDKIGPFVARVKAHLGE